MSVAGAGSRRSKTNPLDKKIPSNPRYRHVAPTINSGSTINKVKTISTREIAKRRNEVFARIRPSALYSMIVEHEETGAATSEFAATTQGPQMVTVAPNADRHEDKPFLLVDIRSAQEFSCCHIMDALNFPSIMLNQDKIPYELLRFRNKDGTNIIVYDDDEREAPEFATRLIQKGYENTVLLSGGLKAVGNKYPILLDGDLPSDLIIPPSPEFNRTGRASTMSTRRGNERAAASDATASIASTKRNHATTPTSTVRTREPRKTAMNAAAEKKYADEISARLARMQMPDHAENKNLDSVSKSTLEQAPLEDDLSAEKVTRREHASRKRNTVNNSDAASVQSRATVRSELRKQRYL